MKKFKKLICVALAGMMVLSACACNKEEQSSGNGSNGGKEASSGDKSAAKQYVYSSEDIDLGVDLENVSIYNMTCRDGKIYAIIEEYNNDLVAEPWVEEVEAETVDTEESDAEATDTEEAKVAVENATMEVTTDIAIDSDMSLGEDDYAQMEYYGPSYYLVSANIDGSEQNKVQLTMDDKLIQGYMSGVYLLQDATVAAMYETNFEDLTDPNNPVWTTEFYLMKWDSEGNRLWTTDMTPEDGSYLYAQSISTDAEGNLTIITSDNQIITMNAQGEETHRMSIESSDNDYTGQFITKADGSIYLISYNNEWTKIYISQFDLATGQRGEKTELPSNLMNYSIYAGNTTDLLLSNSYGIYTYNIGDEEPTMVMDFINSDLATYGLNNIAFLDDNQFVAMYYDSVNYVNHIAKFTYVDPKDIPDKISLTLGCNYLGSDVKRRVIDFNKTNTQYRITIKDYSSYNTMDDYTVSYTQMNNDIISGKMPDLMIVDSSQDISSWVNKGLLTDIEEMIAQDEELSQVEFLQNVWDAFSVNDKLYTVIPSFNVQTMTARKDVVGDRTGWTMSEFVEFMKTQDAEVKPFGDDMLRDSILSYVMTYCGSDFVDINTGKCNFNSEEFIAMLEYANTFPAEFPDDYWDNYNWESTQSQYREGKAILLHTYISNIRDLVYTLHGYLGTEATFVGYPGLSGNSSVIQPSGNMFVLSAKSANKDGAWEFVRYYLSDEYQNSEELYNLPVSKSAFEAKAQLATERPYWIDENGEKVEYDHTFYMNGEEIVLEPFSQEEVDAICEFIYSVNKRSYYNQDIINIVNEETQSYFEGQKSSRDVASIIQSRVQLYVDENR